MKDEQMNHQPTDYTAIVRPVSEDGRRFFEAVFREFQRGIVGIGSSPAKALGCLLDEAKEFFADAASTGDSLPEPYQEQPWDSYSGKVTVRLPQSLHFKMHILAEEEGVSLNTLIVSGLSCYAEMKHCQLRPLQGPQLVANHLSMDMAMYVTNQSVLLQQGSVVPLDPIQEALVPARRPVAITYAKP